MKRDKLARLAAVVLAGALMVVAFAGCMPKENPVNDEQAANRQYMSTVATTMDTLGSRLSGFEDAVSRGDLVAMRTEADNAFKAIDELAALEAPEPLKELHTMYVDGCTTLKDALNDYIALYTEIGSATEAHPFDYSTLDGRVKDIQDKYNDGIAQLEAADKKAAEL